MKTGVELIAEERIRQIEEEGHTIEGDTFCNGQEELAYAAICYATPFKDRVRFENPKLWPWHPDWWNPTPDSRVRELTKAGALIAAEIDRLQHGLEFRMEEFEHTNNIEDR